MRRLRYAPALVAALGGLPLLLFCSAGARPSSQNQPSAPTAPATEPSIELLHLKQTAIFPGPPPNAYRTVLKCDADGDVFLQALHIDFRQPPTASYDPISELDMDSKQIVIFGGVPLPADRYPRQNFRYFQVDSSGTLYALLSTYASPSTQRDAESPPRPHRGPEYYIERFSSDGTTDSLTHLDLPPDSGHWTVSSFGLFPGASFLITGTSTPTIGRPAAGSWEPLTAIYDSRGRFVQRVQLSADVTNNFTQSAASPGPSVAASAAAQPQQSPPPVAGTQPSGPSHDVNSTKLLKRFKPSHFFDLAIAQGGIVNAPDGNVWILRASDPLRLYAVNSAGEVMKRFQFSSPASGLSPTNAGIAGPGRLFFGFDHLAGQPMDPSWPDDVIGIFNTDSGRWEAFYKLPDTVGFRNLACGDGRDGFLYVGTTSDRHLAVFDYTP